MLKFPLISVDWLYDNLKNENLIILDCSIPKVTSKSELPKNKSQESIEGAIFFDIKKIFSDNKSPFPNTVLSPQEFEEKVQNLGINNDSFIVCYDDLGIYSSPRVWWMFQLMGFKNIVVLDGGLPKWIEKKRPTIKKYGKTFLKGNFKVDYQYQKLKLTKDVFKAIDNTTVLIVDARSRGRFLGTDLEPRKEIKSGHIPNSINLPYNSVLENGIMKPKTELALIFNNLKNNKNKFIFTCGSGITASILALAAEIAGIKNYAVYDGSWTEWSLTKDLPIEI